MVLNIPIETINGENLYPKLNLTRLQHPFNFISAYNHFTGNEPVFTNFTQGYTNVHITQFYMCAESFCRSFCVFFVCDL